MNKEFWKYIASVLLFGSNGIVASHIALTSYETVFFRAGIGMLILSSLFLLSRKKCTAMQRKKEFFFLALAGMSQGGLWLFLYEAYQQAGVGMGTLLCYCGAVIVMALGPVLFHERLTVNKCIGFLAVVVGLVCLNLQAFREGANLWGIFCGGMSAVMYTLLVIANKQAPHIAGIERAMWQIVFSFLVIAVFLLFRQGLVIKVPAESVPYVLLLGGMTGVGCYMFLSSMGRLPVQTVAVCGYLEPFSAVVLSAVLLGETMGPLQTAGAALILGGAMFAELKGRS